MEQRIDASAAETRRHFETTLEAVDHKFQLLTETVAHIDEKLDQVASITEEMRTGFAETQSMIKFSHGELDRLTRVEDDLATRKARVDRIESSTQ